MCCTNLTWRQYLTVRCDPPQDLEDFGMDKVIEMALEAAWDGCDAVYMSCEL